MRLQPPVGGGEGHRQELRAARTLGFGQVLALDVSPDGRFLAAAGRGGSSVHLIGTESWSVVQTLEGHARAVTSIAFGPGGRHLVSGSEDGTVRLWDVEAERARWVGGGSGDTVWSVAFSDTGKVLASGRAGQADQVQLWDPATGEVIRRMGGHLWSVSSVALSPDGSLLASGSCDQKVRLWAVPGGEPVRTLDSHEDHILAVAFSPCGDLLASCSVDKTVRLWEVRSGRLVRTLRGHAAPVVGVAFAPDGKVLASGSTDHTVRLWSVAEWRPLGTLAGHAGWVNAVAFSADGGLLATGSEDQTVRLWDRRSARMIRSILPRANWVDRVNFSQDGVVLTTHTREGKALRWEVSTGKLVEVADDPGPEISSRRSRPSAASPDRAWVALGRADGSVLLTAAEGKPAHRLTGHDDRVECLAFSPDEMLLASGSRDGTAKLWEVSTLLPQEHI